MRVLRLSSRSMALVTHWRPSWCLRWMVCFYFFKAANNTHQLIRKYSINLSNGLAVLGNFRGRESQKIFLKTSFCKPMIYSL